MPDLTDKLHTLDIQARRMCARLGDQLCHLQRMQR